MDLNATELVKLASALADPLTCDLWSISGALTPDVSADIDALHEAVVSQSIREHDLSVDFYRNIGAILQNCIKRATVAVHSETVLPAHLAKIYDIVLGVTATPEFMEKHTEYWPEDFAASIVRSLVNRLQIASADTFKFQERMADKMGGVAASTATPDATQPISGSIKNLKQAADGAVAPVESNTAANSTALPKKNMKRGNVNPIEECSLMKVMLWYIYREYPSIRALVQQEVYRATEDFVFNSNQMLAAAARQLGLLIEAIIRSAQVDSWKPVNPYGAVQPVEYRKWFQLLLEMHKVPGQIAESTSVLSLFHEPLVLSTMHFVTCPGITDPLLHVIRAIDAAWEETKLGNSSKALLLANEIIQMLALPQAVDNFTALVLAAFPVIEECLSSENSRLAQLGLGLFKDDRILNAFLADSSHKVLRRIVGLLWRDGTPHWNATVNKQTHTVLTKLISMDPDRIYQAFAEALDMPDSPPAHKMPRRDEGAERPSATSNHRAAVANPPVTITGVAPWKTATPTFNTSAVKAQPPVTITGVAPWKTGPVTVSRAHLPPSTAANVTVTGVAPWAHPPRSGATTAHTDAHNTTHVSSEHNSNEAKHMLQNYLLSLLPPPVSSISLYGCEAPPPENNDILAPVPKLKPTLAFHDLVFGHDLGAGSFSVVRYAKHIRRGASASSWPEYAVKIISTKTMAEMGYEPSVRREITVLSMMSHPNIARLVSAFRWRDGAYLVTEYAPKGDLHTVLTQLGSFDKDTVRFITAEILAALSHVHSKGFVFGDVKPENILLVEAVDGGSHIKLTDFGACRAVTDAAKDVLHEFKDILKNLRNGDWRAHAGIEAAPTEADSTAAEAGTELSNAEDERLEGTEEYLPPEVTAGGMPSIASDAYALGVTIYQLLKGSVISSQEVWPELFLAEDGSKHRVRMKTKPEDLFAGVDEDASDIIRQLLHPDPAIRLGGGPRGTADIMEHPYFRKLGTPDDIMVLYSRAGPVIKAGISAPQADPAWSRRHNSTIWAPMPKAYTPLGGGGGGAGGDAGAASGGSCSIRELLGLPSLPAAARC